MQGVHGIVAGRNDKYVNWLGNNGGQSRLNEVWDGEG